MYISDILRDLEQITKKINNNSFIELSRIENETLEDTQELFNNIFDAYGDIQAYNIFTSVETATSKDDYEMDYINLTNLCVDATDEIDDLISMLENENKRITKKEIIKRLNSIKNYIEQ